MVVIFDLDGTLFETEPNTAAAARANIRRRGGELYPEAMETLYTLNKLGYSMVLCSSGSNEYIDVVLSRTKIGRFFNRFVSAREYVNGKTNALGELLRDFPEAVYVGDIGEDFDAAKSNKIPFIAALYGYGDAEALKAACFTVNSPQEIISCAERLKIFYNIKRMAVDRGCKIIGINGIDTSGKTEFSKALSRFFTLTGTQNAVLHIDDFHNPREIRRSGDYYDTAFDLQTITYEVLKPLRESGEIDRTLTCLDLDTDTYKNTRHYKVADTGVLIAEGTLLFRPPLSEYFDMKIFLKIDFDEAINRAKIRDVPKYGEQILESYKSRYFPAQERYFLKCVPETAADVIIDNTDWKFPGLEK